MPLSRRAFLELAGGTLAYGFSFSCTGDKTLSTTAKEATDHARRYFVDYRAWLFIHPDGSVTAHTGRTELGQGLKTVLSNIITQGLDLPPDRVELVMGDTELCPDDGPTEGSSATRIVGWGYWHACERVRKDLIRRAGKRLRLPIKKLEYAEGVISDRNDRSRRVGIGELVDGTVQLATLDPAVLYRKTRPYEDRGTAAVNADAIVTGTLVFAGDLFPGECDYGAYLLPKYHYQMALIDSVDVTSARRVPGVKSALTSGNSAFIVADSYTNVHRGLEALNPVWKDPGRPSDFNNQMEIRSGAELVQIISERGNPHEVLSRSRQTLVETYVTQYASQVPIETETAVSRAEGERITTWASTQAPFKARARIVERLQLPEKNVRITGMPVGGGFGVKVDTAAPEEAAVMAYRSGRTVKHVYSRAGQFINRARYKEAVIIDIESACLPDGRLTAQTIDIFQDEGFGTTDVYRIPNVLTRHFQTDVPPRHGTMRGTSFVQSCFALESHIDMLAEVVGLDPLDFRKRNLEFQSFAPLLDACAGMIDYRPTRSQADRGTGFAICHHGGRQMGAVAAEVAVDRSTGVIRVEKLSGAYDIGQVININTLTANTNGAMIWGLGFALFEEVDLDGHVGHTRSLDDYRIPRFSDVPPIELAFLDNEIGRGHPRGCGELPVPPTAAAICNAVYRAIGVRFHHLPMTPERVRAALE